jgi:hypothetical protein
MPLAIWKKPARASFITLFTCPRHAQVCNFLPGTDSMIFFVKNC